MNNLSGTYRFSHRSFSTTKLPLRKSICSRKSYPYLKQVIFFIFLNQWSSHCKTGCCIGESVSLSRRTNLRKSFQSFFTGFEGICFTSSIVLLYNVLIPLQTLSMRNFWFVFYNFFPLSCTELKNMRIFAPWIRLWLIFPLTVTDIWFQLPYV